MRTFDTGPINQKIPEGKRTLTVRQVTSPIIDICVLKKRPALFYIAHGNGTLKSWSYSDNGGWVHLGNINLCVSQDAELQAVAIDESRGRVIWVEGHTLEGQDGCQFSVCTRTITFETTDVKHSIGPPTTLLQNCPKCALYCSPLAITIWPSDPCPVGLYFTWHSDAYRLKNQLDTHILGGGPRLSEDRASVVVDFKVAATALRDVWVQNASQPDLQLVARACHVSTSVLFLISSNGCVHTLNGAEETLNVLQLPAKLDIGKCAKWFAYRFALGAVCEDHVIRIFSNKTGEPLQELNMSTISMGTDAKLWCIVGSIPRIGVWTSKGIWVMQMDNVESLPSTMSKSEAALTLGDFGEKRLAARTALHGAYEAYSGRSKENVQAKGLTGPLQGFQSPCLAVSLLQEADANHKPQASRALKTLYETKDQDNDPGTQLNDNIRPLLQQYWQLYQKKLAVMDDQSKVNLAKPLTVEDVVSQILDVSAAVSPKVRQTWMTHLCLHVPMATLFALLDALNIGHYDKNGHITFQAIPLEDAELDPGLPIISLAVMAPESESGLPLFEILCRLIFQEFPSQLVEFVNLCQQVRHKVMDVSAFSRKKTTVQLYDTAIGCLPGPDHSKDRDAAVLATAELMQLSSMSHGAVNALKTLLRHKLWSDAISLVRKRSDNSQTHSELFHILLTSLLQGRDILPEYYDGLWECLPKKISPVEFLKLLSTHHQPSNPRIHLCQQVMCQPQDDLQIGMVREQLTKMLGREKVKGQSI